jgi:glycerol transport system ATP-binding protein
VTFVLDHIGLSVGETPVIADVSLSLEQGTINVLLGPTLAGKTTLMRLVAGLDRPTTGRILANDADITRVSVRSGMSDASTVTPSHLAPVSGS